MMIRPFHTVMCCRCFRNLPSAEVPPEMGWLVCFDCLHQSRIPAGRVETSEGTHQMTMNSKVDVQL